MTEDCLGGAAAGHASTSPPVMPWRRSGRWRRCASSASATAVRSPTLAPQRESGAGQPGPAPVGDTEHSPRLFCPALQTITVGAVYGEQEAVLAPLKAVVLGAPDLPPVGTNCAADMVSVEPGGFRGICG